MFASGQETAIDETPAALHKKVAERSYLGKFKTFVIDKEVTSMELPQGTSLRSRTYFIKGKAREETFLLNPLGMQITFITIFTKENTYISYDNGAKFQPFNEVLITRINNIINKADYFSQSASKVSKNFYNLNGRQCYVVGENFGGSQKLTFIEKDSYLILRIVVPNGKNERTVTDMSDYRNIQGVSIPFNIRVSAENLKEKTASVTEIKITNFQPNLNLNPALFIPSNVSQTYEAHPVFDIKGILKNIL